MLKKLSSQDFCSISKLIICTQKFLYSNWERACQLITNSAKSANTKLVQKVEIKID